MNQCILFVMTALYILVLDMIWLGFLAKDLYRQSIGSLLRTSGTGMAPNWTAAAIVYILLAAGIIFFVLPKTGGSYVSALIWGMAFGVVVYGVYDFTNLAILANWPVNITIIDLLWGTVLCGFTSVFATFVQQWLNR